MRFHVALLILSLGCCGAALADGARVALLEGDFVAQKAAITDQLKDGKTFNEITSENRREVLNALDRMEAILAGKNSVDDLNPQQRTELFNHQEVVNVLLTNAERDSRVLCDRRQTLGSHMRKTQCESVAERRARHEAARNLLERTNRGQQLNSKG